MSRDDGQTLKEYLADRKAVIDQALAGAEIELVTAEHRETRLKKALAGEKLPPPTLK
mgnify:CR=1 FL=1